MNAALLAAALGLLAAWPAAGLGRIAGETVDRRTRDPRWRERAWSLGLWLAPAVAVLTPALAVLRPEPIVHPALHAGVWIPAPPPAAAVEAAPALAALLVAASAAGLLWAALGLLADARRFARISAEARPAAAPAVLRALAEAERLGLRPPAVRVSAAITRPVLVGLRRPVILLPEALAEADGERLLMICRHELAHWTRRDGLRLSAERLVLGAFWFVPPLRGLQARAAAAREEDCDARALQGAAPHERRAYARVLIDALRLRAGPEGRPAFTGARKETAMRLQAILKPAAPLGRGARMGLGALALAVAAVAGAGSAALAHGAGQAAHAGTRNSVHSYTSVTTADEPGGPTNVAVTVRSDRHEELPGGRTVASGGVEVEVRGAPAGLIEVDGRPQPAGFDARSLQGRIARVETRGAEGEGQPVFNLITR